jgi:hypothetical protein
MTEFGVFLRGYDRAAVDQIVRAVRAAGDDPARIEAVLAEMGPLPVVLRGYAREQVDAWLDEFRTAEPPAAEPESALPELPVVLRGYTIEETDRLVTAVQAALDGDDAGRRAAALRAITGARLPVGFRGYDRATVDAYLQRSAKELRTR